MVACGGGVLLSVGFDGCGSSVCNPVGFCSITTIMNTMMRTSRTSIRGVTFILGPVENEPPPAVENPIRISSLLPNRKWNRHARVLHALTPEWCEEFPTLACAVI